MFCQFCKREYTGRGIKFCSRTCVFESGILTNTKSMLGRKHSEETKEKIRKANTGFKISEETRQKLRDSHKGQVAWNKSKTWSPEVIDKLRKAKLGKVCSIETRLKMSLVHKQLNSWGRLRSGFGKDAANWQGGKTEESKRIRNSGEYTAWRKGIFERDGYTCQLCGSRNGDGKTIELQADHIKPFAYFPELRLAIDNGRTLCVPCHKKTETYGSKAVKQQKALHIT